MRFIYLPCILFALVIFKPGLAQNTPKFITAYTDDFSGNHYDFEVGSYDFTYLAQSGMPVIYSFKIPAGLQVVLYREDNFRGTSLVLTGDVHTKYLQSQGFATIGLTISMAVQIAPVQTSTAVSTSNSVVTLYKDNFSGDSKTLGPGEYEFTDFGIGNDQLSSIKIPKGMKVTVYQHQAFEGKSLVLTKDTGADFFVAQGFNDAVSSMRVEGPPVAPVVPQVVPQTVPVTTPVVVPVVTAPIVITTTPKPLVEGPHVIIYRGNFRGDSIVMTPGKYKMGTDLSIDGDDEFTLRIPYGMKVTLYDAAMNNNKIGKVLTLTEDASHAEIVKRGFGKNTAWVYVEELPPPVPTVTIYKDDFNGVSATLPVGKYIYWQFEIGDNTLSSISIPRGLSVTLYDNQTFDGRSVQLRNDAAADFFVKNQFNDKTSSLVVEEVPAIYMVVTIYQNNFSGASKSFGPGRYSAADLGIGNNQLSSVQVPYGMKVTLYDNDNFTGRSISLTKDGRGDFIMSNKFNDLTSSIVVEDAFVPVVAPIEVAPVNPEPVVVVPIVVPTVVPDNTPVQMAVDCEMKASQMTSAQKSIESEAFSAGKLSVAQIATKNKCLSIAQIRTILSLFSWDEQKLEFVKGAYDSCTAKDDYYTLADVFTFGSSKDNFNAFLKEK